jgi:hypothetical protein
MALEPVGPSVPVHRCSRWATPIALVLIVAAGARADVFLDFGLDDVQVSPTGPGSYVVSVSVLISPGPLPPTQSISLDVVRNGITTVASTGVQTVGVPSTQCCANKSTCEAVAGHVVTCDGSCPGGGPPAHVCNYHRSNSFGPLALSPGDTLTVTLDGAGAHTETEAGAPANNSVDVVVPPDVVSGSLFSDFGVEAVHALPVGGGAFDVAVDVLVAPEVVAPTGSIPVRLLADGDEVGTASVDTSGQSAQICCTCGGACPSPPQGSVCCTGSCTDPAQNETAKCVCEYEGTASFGTMPLAPGTVLTAVLDPDGAHTETLFGAVENNSLSATITSAVPVDPAWALVALAALLLVSLAVVNRRSARGASGGG